MALSINVETPTALIGMKIAPVFEYPQASTPYRPTGFPTARLPGDFVAWRLGGRLAGRQTGRLVDWLFASLASYIYIYISVRRLAGGGGGRADEWTNGWTDEPMD